MMTPRPTPLFWCLTCSDFTRAIKRSRSGINAVAAQIRGKLSSLAPTLNRSAVAAGPITRAGEGSLAGQPSRVRLIGGSDVHGAKAVPHPLSTDTLLPNSSLLRSSESYADAKNGMAGVGLNFSDLGTKYLNTLIHAKPAAQSGDSERNSADTPDRGRLGGNF